MWTLFKLINPVKERSKTTGVLSPTEASILGNKKQSSCKICMNKTTMTQYNCCYKLSCKACVQRTLSNLAEDQQYHHPHGKSFDKHFCLIEYFYLNTKILVFSVFDYNYIYYPVSPSIKKTLN